MFSTPPANSVLQPSLKCHLQCSIGKPHDKYLHLSTSIPVIVSLHFLFRFPTLMILLIASLYMGSQIFVLV